MLTVTTRELKQNPAAVVRHVLDAGEPAAVTAYGTPTGVVLAPETPVRRAWVSGAALVDAVADIDSDLAQTWQRDSAGTGDEFGRDLWGEAA